MKKNVIISPHPDDEIIGGFSLIINKENPPIIIYTCMDEMDNTRREETKRLREFTNISVQLYQQSIPPIFLNNNYTLYFPDYYEIHPDHRKYFAIGEEYLRKYNLDVVFYSINMNVPYIHKLNNFEEKENLLNNVYSSQKKLWEYEKKYIFFEGICKWII